MRPTAQATLREPQKPVNSNAFSLGLRLYVCLPGLATRVCAPYSSLALTLETVRQTSNPIATPKKSGSDWEGHSATRTRDIDWVAEPLELEL